MENVPEMLDTSITTKIVSKGIKNIQLKILIDEANLSKKCACFRENPTSRLYGYKMIDYRNNPHSIGADLPHLNCNWEKISKRLGWLTWADLEVRK